MSVAQNMIVTLSTEWPFGPISITAREDQRIMIMDHHGTLIARISEVGASATFEIQQPKWWQFWRGPRWVKSGNGQLRDEGKIG